MLFPVSSPVRHIIATSSLDHHPFPWLTCWCTFFFSPVGVSYIILFPPFFLFLSAPLVFCHPFASRSLCTCSICPSSTPSHVPPLLSPLFNPRCCALSYLWSSHVRTIFTPSSVFVLWFSRSYYGFSVPSYTFCSSQSTSGLFSSIPKIVLCIPLFTFLSFVRMMDRFHTFIFIDRAIFPPPSLPPVAAHTSL